ncbi:AAA family ATPase [Jannaschia pohangensis]|uniref:Nicotinamide-nucleotide adenylyltransferase, NadR type n=1 Tax=Jannaschia pohangensis TaxID=390807 RepID=A0A1I3MJR4_9RHOB|nr:AAA family ATPase [Jannaschia pohangensis]SFI96965.1 nicotinamide-nucleotide adenylyltransferase, NadR type [Jannaschia pohangensis]
MTTRGFLLGKFMPLHAGHLFLIDVAARHVDQLSVMLCTRDVEPIAADLRAGWMRASLPLGVRLLHMHRDIPQEPADHPDFWAIWRAAVREHHPAPIDVVFGSEPYVEPFARVLDARPFPVDIDRQTVPISATDIRLDPAAHWPHVPPAVRPHFQRRICLMGPESCGKSTLAETLAHDLGTLHIPEQGRAYDALFRQGADWTPDDFTDLARRHMSVAGAIAARAGPVLPEDTDLLQTMIWARFLLGHVPEALLRVLAEFVPAHLYLLMTPDVPWVQDGTRYQVDPSERRAFFEECRALLDRVGASYVVVSGPDHGDRLRQARAVIA